MDPEHKKKIQLNFLLIKDNLGEVDEVVDHLIQMETFTLEQRSKIINCNGTARENIQRLIDCLIKAGPLAYNNFITALQNTGNGFVVEKLNETVIETPVLSRVNTYVIDKGKTESTNSSTEEEDISLRELKDSICKLESNVTQMQQERKDLDTRLSNTINELQEEVKLYRQNAEEFLITKQNLEAKEEEYKTLQEAYKKLKEQLEESKQRLDNRNKENIQQTKQIEELEGQMSEVKKEMENVEEERANMKQVYQTLTDKINKKETEIRIIREEAEKNLKEQETACKKSQRDKDNLKQQNAALQEQLLQQQKMIETLQVAVEEISKMKVMRESSSPPFCSAGSGDKSSKNRYFNNNNRYKPPAKVQININKKKQ